MVPSLTVDAPIRHDTTDGNNRKCCGNGISRRGWGHVHPRDDDDGKSTSVETKARRRSDTNCDTRGPQCCRLLALRELRGILSLSPPLSLALAASAHGSRDTPTRPITRSTTTTTTTTPSPRVAFLDGPTCSPLAPPFLLAQPGPTVLPAASTRSLLTLIRFVLFRSIPFRCYDPYISRP